LDPVLAAFLLTAGAGLATGIGSAIPFFFKDFKKKYLAFFLGLSAGVMIIVSFMELMVNALQALESYWVYLAFFVGMGVVALIDFLIPHEKNLHHMQKDCDSISKIQEECQDCEEEEKSDEEDLVELRVTDEETGEEAKTKSLTRTGVLTALAIAIHNFPEGIATFATALDDISLGITIAIAIAIHNIPEGISVSIPIYFATKSKWKSFGISLASGMAEPIGAAIAYLILRPFLTPAVLAISLASVAGIMVYISIDELIPVAHEYGSGHLVMGGVVLGMLIMAGSLVLFKFL